MLMAFVVLGTAACLAVAVIGYCACVAAGRADDLCEETCRRQALAQREIL